MSFIARFVVKAIGPDLRLLLFCPIGSLLLWV